MALFKIFKGKDKTKLNAMPKNDGYAYYNTSNGLFYIDAEYPSENDSNQLVLDRRPINAQRAFYDSHNNTEIYKTYIKDIKIENSKLSYTTGDDISHPVTLSKIYSGVIGTANNWAGATFFFGNIKPLSWYTPWRIKYRIRTYVPNKNGYDLIADVIISGDQDVIRSFSSFNTVGPYYPAYYHVIYRMKKNGFDNGYGHALGIRFYSAYSPIDVNYKRTIEIDFYDSDNCTFEFFDNCLLYLNIPGTGSTNYNAYTEINYCANGLLETGDNNDVNYLNRIYYTSSTAAEQIYRYLILLRTRNQQLLPVSSANNNTSTIDKIYSSTPFDPFGEIYYYNTTTAIAPGGNVGNNILYRLVLADLRYSFGLNNTANYKLIARLPVYLTATPLADGTAILTKIDGSLIGPLALTLPSTEDGLIYIYLGLAYEDTNPYRIELTLDHPIYWYKNGSVKLFTVNNYTLPKATDSVLGGIKTGYSASGKNYAIKVDTNGNAYVNVPWTDKKVTLSSNLTGNGLYRILLSHGTNDEEETDTINKSGNLTFNPSALLLSIGGSITATGNLTLAGNAYLNNETYTDNLTAGSLLVTGNSNFTQIPTAPTPADDSDDTSVATTAFVKKAFVYNDAMVFKGVLGSGSGMISSLPSTYKQGWTYKIGTAGTYAGLHCEVGDTIYCTVDGDTANNANWTIIQTNIDGYVFGPTDTTTGITQDGIALFTGTTGKAIKDSGKTITTIAPASNDNNTVPTSGAVYSAITGASGYGKTGTVTSVQVLASSPLQSSTNTAQSTSLNTIISFKNQNPNTILAGPSSGSAAAPTFRSLVAADIPSLDWSKITSGNDDLKAIENLSGTSGLLKKTAANTWTLDTTSYTTNTGTVTKIIAGTGLNTSADLAETATKGSITASGTLYLTLSGVTANTYGNTSQLTPSHGGTFNIPYFTVDKYGRITSASTTTVKLPTDNNTDTKVNVVKRGTAKSYILGDTTAPPDSAAAHTAVAESYIYMTSTVGQMSAKSYSFNDGASTPTEKAQMIYNTTTGCLEIIVA